MPLIGDMLTGLGGVMKSSSLGVMDMEAPVSKSRITLWVSCDRKQCLCLDSLDCASKADNLSLFDVLFLN